jgi:hypothetical protein
MRVEGLILRLGIEKYNKLFERRVNSYSMASKANIMEQVAKSYNKNQKKNLVIKGKGIFKNSMASASFTTRLDIRPRIAERELSWEKS